MSESYSKPIQDEITQKYHWVNGLDEYLASSEGSQGLANKTYEYHLKESSQN